MLLIISTAVVRTLFSILQTFQDFSSHRMRHMHEALNKQKLITQSVCKSRDESFKPS